MRLLTRSNGFLPGYYKRIKNDVVEVNVVSKYIKGGKNNKANSLQDMLQITANGWHLQHVPSCSLFLYQRPRRVAVLKWLVWKSIVNRLRTTNNFCPNFIPHEL